MADETDFVADSAAGVSPAAKKGASGEGPQGAFGGGGDTSTQRAIVSGDLLNGWIDAGDPGLGLLLVRTGDAVRLIGYASPPAVIESAVPVEILALPTGFVEKGYGIGVLTLNTTNEVIGAVYGYNDKVVFNPDPGAAFPILDTGDALQINVSWVAL